MFDSILIQILLIYPFCNQIADYDEPDATEGEDVQARPPPALKDRRGIRIHSIPRSLSSELKSAGKNRSFHRVPGDFHGLLVYQNDILN